MARDDKYSSTGSDADYSASPFKNADSPAVSTSSEDSDGSDSVATSRDTSEPEPRDQEAATSTADTPSDDSDDASTPSEIITRNGVPYAMARSKVTDHREQKQFQLLKETRFDLQDAVADLTKRYDDDNLSETDALEIILRTGLAHADDFDTAAHELGFGLENIQFSFTK